MMFQCLHSVKTNRHIAGLVVNESGAAMVEFAIAVTVFSVLLLGILEFGFAAWAKNSVAADAREGARYAIVHGSQSGRVATPDSVTNFVKARTNLDATIVVTTNWSPDNKPGSLVKVRVKHVVPRRGPFLAAHTDSSSSTMIILF